MFNLATESFCSHSIGISRWYTVLNCLARSAISQTVSSVTLRGIGSTLIQQVSLLGDAGYPRVVLHFNDDSIRIGYPVSRDASIG